MERCKQTFTRPTGSNHQKVILKHQLQSDQATGPDHQHVVLKKRDGSIESTCLGQLADSDDSYFKGLLADSDDSDSANSPLQPANVYIFNHEKFDCSTKDRRGSSEDVKALRKTFKKLQCNVIKIQDPTLAKVKHEVFKLTVKNFESHSALVVVILSHGKRKEIIETCDGQHYSLDDDVLFPLFGNQSLRGKPKILIVQACKGSLVADASPQENCCDPRDYIKCYSTTEGYLSYRDESTGSVYIQTLCKVMDQDALTKDFRRIIEDVNAQVVEESTKNSSTYKQVPAMTTTFYRRYCFGDYVKNANGLNKRHTI